MTARRTDLQVEELGQRVLPSISGLGIFEHEAIVRHHGPQQPAHALHGSGFAVFTSTMQIPDTGTAYQLQGVGAFAALGFVTITGELHSVGFIQNGHATGTITFTNANGSVTVALTGPAQGGFAPLPHEFQYRITAGTGAYQNLRDHGTLHLQMTGSPAMRGTPGFGVFTIRI
jgi:hypothetical protein